MQDGQKKRDPWLDPIGSSQGSQQGFQPLSTYVEVNSGISPHRQRRPSARARGGSVVCRRRREPTKAGVEPDDYAAFLAAFFLEAFFLVAFLAAFFFNT